jgi:predicted  nucleic acid-binding Zn-ribbon protein
MIEEKDKPIREQAQTRLEMLREELETGQTELQKVESQRTYLRETILRISGAVQVLEELLAQGQSTERNGAALSKKQSPTVRAEGTNV